MFAKISILIFYRDLSPFRYFRISVYSLMAIIIGYGLTSAFYFLFACRPISKYWDITNQDGSCIDLEKYWYSSAAVNCVTDFVMLGAPIFMLWPAPIPRRQKAAVLAIFMVGGL
jgi:hypothetical protein